MQRFITTWKQLLDFFIFTIIVIIGLILLVNINFYPVPITDVFQFIGDSEAYAEMKLPANIHAAPVNPVLIGIISRLLFAFSYPEVIASVLISIGASNGLAVLTWLIAKRELNIALAMLLLVFFFTHPLFFVLGLDADSTPLFTLLVLLSLFLYKKKPQWAYSVSAAAFLVRYEAIMLVLALFFVDMVLLAPSQLKHLSLRSLWKLLPVQHMRIPTVIILSWILIVFVRNFFSQVPFGNYYLFEISSRSGDIPDWRFFTELIGKAVWGFLALTQTVKIVFFTVFSLISMLIFVFFWKKRMALPMQAGVFTVLYLLMHVWFPFYTDRYFYPVIIPLALFFYSFINALFNTPKLSFQGKTLTIFFIFGLVYIIFFNIVKIIPELENSRNYHRPEYRMLSEWINGQKITEERKLLSLHSEIISYFKNHPNVHQIKDLKSFNCNSIFCILSQLNIQKDIWVAIGKANDNVDSFSLMETGIKSYSDFEEKECLEEVQQFHYLDRWLTLYNYNYSKCQSMFSQNL